MDLNPYATAFYDEVIKYFNARLTIIESDYVIAFQLEYLDSLAAPSIEFEKQDIESLLRTINPKSLGDRLVIEGAKTGDLLIIKFPRVWGVKPKNPLYWGVENGKDDAVSFLKITGR